MGSYGLSKYIFIITLTVLSVIGIQYNAQASADKYESGVNAYMQGDYNNAYLLFQSHLKDNPNHGPSQEWLKLIKPYIADKKEVESTPTSPAQTPKKIVIKKEAKKEKETVEKKPLVVPEKKDKKRGFFASWFNKRADPKKENKAKKPIQEKLALKKTKSKPKTASKPTLDTSSQLKKFLARNNLLRQKNEQSVALTRKLRTEVVALNQRLKSQESKASSEYTAQIEQLQEVSSLLSDTQRTLEASNQKQYEAQKKLMGFVRSNEMLNRQIQNLKATQSRLQTDIKKLNIALEDSIENNKLLQTKLTRQIEMENQMRDYKRLIAQNQDALNLLTEKYGKESRARKMSEARLNDTLREKQALNELIQKLDQGREASNQKIKQLNFQMTSLAKKISEKDLRIRKMHEEETLRQARIKEKILKMRQAILETESFIQQAKSTE